jgi:hypothetical protein
VRGPVDLAHPALAEELAHLVLGERLARIGHSIVCLRLAQLSSHRSHVTAAGGPVPASTARLPCSR